ncbi:MAG: flagellar motor switch protein FliG [Desulfobacterales bacterium]|jgi:flagellar motor switch protein FliG|nr:flagellar motor switch protein FliG [Desulfobacterales bacterium]
MGEKKIDLKNMSGPEKAAVFLLAIGEVEASKVFKKMNDEEIKKVAGIMADLDKVAPEVLDAVSEEFVGRLEGGSRGSVKGEAFFKALVGSSLEKGKAEKLLQELEEERKETPFEWSSEVDPSVFRDHLMGEHPQTIAMILAYLPPNVSAEILFGLPDDKKGDIAIRIARLGQVPKEIVRQVDETLRNELKKVGTSGEKVGGIQALVDILNNLDRASEDIILETIEEEHAEMVVEIRGMMFVFEDLIKVDDRGMREILKKVENQQLVLAMKTASEEMKQKIVGNLSTRAAEMLMEDLEVMGPVRLTEVEEAQQAIIRAAKELEADGTITLGGKGKEDVLV